MKRILSAVLLLALCAMCASAFAYTRNSDGLYVDGSGKVIEELWDDAGGLYIVNGVGYPIEDANSGSGSSYTPPAASSSSGGAMVVNSSDGDTDPTAGLQHNADGSVTVESGQIQIADPSDGSSGQHLTQEEWAARWAKYTAANGSTTGTVYMDENGNVFPAEIVTMGLGRSTITVDGREMIVPTSSLKWDTEAPDDKVLAVVTPEKQSYLTIRAKKSQKSFVLGHSDKCRVLRVIGTGKTWTFVDDNGIRGYVMTSGLTFYDNSPREYAAGIITVKGKTPSGNTVHVRSINKNNSRQIAEYPVGTPVTVFAQDDKWSEIDVEGWHCYILSEFVTLEEPLPAIAAEPEEEKEGG